MELLEITPLRNYNDWNSSSLVLILDIYIYIYKTCLCESYAGKYSASSLPGSNIILFIDYRECIQIELPPPPPPLPQAYSFSIKST